MSVFRCSGTVLWKLEMVSAPGGILIRRGGRSRRPAPQVPSRKDAKKPKNSKLAETILV